MCLLTRYGSLSPDYKVVKWVETQEAQCASAPDPTQLDLTGIGRYNFAENSYQPAVTLVRPQTK